MKDWWGESNKIWEKKNHNWVDEKFLFPRDFVSTTKTPQKPNG
jgi:hypothetical protein